MTTEQIWVLGLQTLFILAYSIGIFIVIKNQKGKIGTLETQVKSYDGIMSKMERFVNIFDLDKIEKYVNVVERTSQKEKDQALREKDEEMRAMLDKAVNLTEKKMAEKFDKNISVIQREMKSMTVALASIIYRSPFNIEVDRSIRDMPDSVMKNDLLKLLVKKQQESPQQQMMNLILSRPELFWNLPKPSTQPNNTEK